jgi:hypothetical protein
MTFPGVARLLFWFGVLWFGLGFFVLATDLSGWFAVATVLTALGFFVPQRFFRIAALAFVCASIFFAYESHKQACAYVQRVQKNLETIRSQQSQP